MVFLTRWYCVKLFWKTCSRLKRYYLIGFYKIKSSYLYLFLNYFSHFIFSWSQRLLYATPPISSLSFSSDLFKEIVLMSSTLISISTLNMTLTYNIVNKRNNLLAFINARKKLNISNCFCFAFLPPQVPSPAFPFTFTLHQAISNFHSATVKWPKGMPVWAAIMIITHRLISID